MSLYPNSYDTQKSLSDDVPICKSAGIGYCTNQIYRQDGNPQEAHPYEDYSNHLKYDNLSLYTVFDGCNGKEAVTFCSQSVLAEPILWSLTQQQTTNENIRELLRQMFNTADLSYLESLNDLLAERAGLLCDIEEVYGNQPKSLDRINQINFELSSQAAAAVVLVYNQRLYVANVGNCRVLLCKTDANSVLKVVQLSIDHDLSNEDEVLRLTQLGVNVNQLKASNRSKFPLLTRCLGNYLQKECYKEYDCFKNATDNPIISEPDIHGGILLDDSCRFLLIMSAGLYKSIEEATGTDQANKFIAECTVQQFREQSTLTGVAQAVVDKTVRLHRDWSMANSHKSLPSKREDTTLLLRNFNFPLPNAVNSPMTSVFNTLVTSTSHSEGAVGTVTSSTNAEMQVPTNLENNPKMINAYVDFTEFNKNYELAKRRGELPEGF